MQTAKRCFWLKKRVQPLDDTRYSMLDGTRPAAARGWGPQRAPRTPSLAIYERRNTSDEIRTHHVFSWGICVTGGTKSGSFHVSERPQRSRRPQPECPTLIHTPFSDTDPHGFTRICFSDQNACQENKMLRLCSAEAVTRGVRIWVKCDTRRGNWVDTRERAGGGGLA